MVLFKKILVANRGEIAIRVMRTCREMGISTVAIFSEADSKALHIRHADEAYCIGTALSADSYLRMDRILDLCKKTGAEAVHPGYGFLSENAKFARMLKENGIVLIGPSAESMEVMGSKIASKQAVKAFGVPLVPGIDEAIVDPESALKVALTVGFPVLVKASAGGGGKGMRVVYNKEDFLSSLQMAQNEARNAFGDDSVFIEKYVSSPRHIEIQIMADNFGNTCYLFERECSIQRRHQKLVEEAPSSVLDSQMRKQMGEAAVNVAKACNYSGAGTVEFLLSESMEFFFLEMNTRLQVEHPVTEMITGIDLVREQILVAAGERLGFSQEDLHIHGHAIELRICAEDPANQFLPNVGRVETYKLPQGIGIRIDDCIESGTDIPIYYDNLLAKLIVWAPTRLQAIDRMRRAISEYVIVGVETTLMFGEFVMTHPAFINGKFNTHFIQEYFTGSNMGSRILSHEESDLLGMAAIQFFQAAQQIPVSQPKQHADDYTAESGLSDWYRQRKEQ
ncbi:MAG: acetyl-CoA carboxylase biotin carboxylase subunit [Flavobacteriaceae bacterium]|nr:acetyl-CoA carboxylase biotin carboxylase subunit [Flavobacteriaceae bacterium]